MKRKKIWDRDKETQRYFEWGDIENGRTVKKNKNIVCNWPGLKGVTRAIRNMLKHEKRMYKKMT